MSKNTSYKKLLKEWMARSKEREDAKRPASEVNLSKLKSHMPLGCWIWAVVLGFGLFALGHWILESASLILP